MRSFVILCSLISTAYAVSVGYNYDRSSDISFGSGGVSGGQFGGQVGGFSSGNQGISGPSYSSSGLGGVSSVVFTSSGQSVAGPSYSSFGASFGGAGLSGAQAGGFNLGGQGFVGPSYSAPAPVGPSYSAPTETVKEFFTYTAPEHEFSDIGDNSQSTGSLKKNLRVIFIKGPENNGLEQAALQLAKSAVNEQTAIYVLSKQADINDLANKLQSLPTQHSKKPEVHFIKYRTSADAENAKHVIQSQYDGLNGPSSSHNGGVAPVLNFASNPAPAAVVQQSYSSAHGVQQSYSSAPVSQQSYSAAPVGHIDNSYLPANKRI